MLPGRLVEVPFDQVFSIDKEKMFSLGLRFPLQAFIVQRINDPGLERQFLLEVIVMEQSLPIYFRAFLHTNYQNQI